MALSAETLKLKESLTCCTYNGSQHTHVLIEEDDVLAKLKKVTLIAPQGDWFSFNPDKGRGRPAVMSPLLTVSASHDHHCACDCVAVINRDGQLTILYLDLKSGNPVGYSKQFKSTRQFVRYALGLLQDLHSITLPIVEERYIVLYGGRNTLLNKKTTVPKKEKIGKTEPTKPYKREVSNKATMYLKELLT